MIKMYNLCLTKLLKLNNLSLSYDNLSVEYNPN